jgi:hypothetical protein
MTPSQRVIEVCYTALSLGPIGDQQHGDYYRSFVSCGFKPALKAPFGSSDIGKVRTSCAVFVRAVLHWAGRSVTRLGEVGQGIMGGWLEGLSYSSEAWADYGKRDPAPGDVGYLAYSKRSSGSESHVMVFLREKSPGIWETAEGGGGDGTTCRISERTIGPKFDKYGRVLIGTWRPDLMTGFGPALNPALPIPPDLLYPFLGLETTDQEFKSELVAVGKRLDIDPNALASIMSVESRFNPAAQNPFKDANGESAVGLIQFMPFLLRAWGLLPANVAKWSAVKQLPLVERFYQFSKGIDDPGTLYMMTFLPKYALQPDSFVLGKKDSDVVRDGLALHKIYLQNAGLDRDKDGDIEVGEVKALARGFYASAKAKLTPRPIRPTLQLKSGHDGKHQDHVKAVQKAVGAAQDGKFGPETERLVKIYQKSHGLDPDGVVGPLTWEKIGT